MRTYVLASSSRPCAGTQTPRPIVQDAVRRLRATQCPAVMGPRSSPGRRCEDTGSHSRGANAPEVFEIVALERQRARGKPGVRCTRSRAYSVGSTRVSHHEFTGNIRLSPRDGFNSLFRALPGDRALLPPSSLRSLLLKNLTPASGCQDHTTSPSAFAPFVKGAICVHRIPFQRP